VAIAHFAFEFRFGDERCDRVDDDHVNGAALYERSGDFESLFSGIRLGDEQIVDIDSELSGINGVERMFGVDKSSGAADFLGLRDDLQGEGGFA
jgi:hypothetical protein